MKDYGKESSLKTKRKSRMNLEEKVRDISSTLKFLQSNFFGKIVFTSSLSKEDQVITHLLASLGINIEIVSLDTGRLFPQTLDLIDTTQSRYSTNIKVLYPNHSNLEKFVLENGINSFYKSVEQRKQCCFHRKVEPLKRALEDKDIWITGIRSEHSENRQGMMLFEKDAKRKLTKYNPLLDWTSQELDDFIKQNNIPISDLHQKGYESIGCQPCTRPIEKGEQARAGRWWWEQSKKECGLHN